MNRNLSNLAGVRVKVPDVDVSVLRVTPGRHLTVYLEADPTKRSVAVELHVDHAGVCRVLLCQEDMTCVNTFDEVYK
jgi:hypothetical protein